MKSAGVVLIAVMVGFGMTMCRAQAPQAVDLTRIERKIIQEPKYQFKPKYCLLVFGSDAKFQVWLVMDGIGTLYVDRNGNGDMTDPGERAQINPRGSIEPGDIDDPPGKTRHRNLIVHNLGMNPGSMSIISAGKHRQRCYPEWSSRAADAPIVHFSGPVTLKLDDPHERISKHGIGPARRLRRGTDASLAGYLGTPGFGADSFAYYGDAKDFLPESSLKIEIEFPAEEKKLASVRAKGVLKVEDRMMLHGDIRVPDNVKLGKVDIKAYLPDRNDIHGAPSTISDIYIVK